MKMLPGGGRSAQSREGEVKKHDGGGILASSKHTYITDETHTHTHTHTDPQRTATSDNIIIIV